MIPPRATSSPCGFRVGAGSGENAIDGADGTDSLEIVNKPFGNRYPQGLAVFQDGIDTPEVAGLDGEPREGSNYKYVDLRDLATVTGLNFR